MYNEVMSNSTKSTSFPCEILYQVSEIGAQVKPWKPLLDDLFAFSRKQFVVDNLAIYLMDEKSQRTEVIYAKSFGRGKSGEADVSWGEAVANQVIQEKRLIKEEPAEVSNKNRLNFPFILSIPVFPYDCMVGAVVYIRFGGPHFTEEEIRYAGYLNQQIQFILQKKLLNEFAEKLTTQSNVSELQQSFINTISHELRNPLGFIKGYTTTLLREDTQWDSPTQKDFLRIIERETNHLEELIDNLLDSSRLQSGQMRFDDQVVSLETLIRDELSRACINHPSLVYHLDFAAGLQPIVGDPDRLAQVFDNLIGNAIKYAPGAELFISVKQIGAQVIIEFRDTGPGIPEEYLGQIFTRFFRVPEQSIKIHGSGLGLSICKEIIQHHNGKIAATSPQEGGLLITIWLPANIKEYELH
jgi:Osmosensitive K+ channel histidine kinase